MNEDTSRPSDSEEYRETITEADRHKAATVADLKRFRMQVTNDLNKILKKFQMDQVTSQGRLNLVWNAINAVIKAFLKKDMVAASKLLTEDDIRVAGMELMKEATQNMELTKNAVASKKQVDREGLTKTPLETFQKIMSDAHLTIVKGGK